jgi:hypothetical protein
VVVDTRYIEKRKFKVFSMIGKKKMSNNNKNPTPTKRELIDLIDKVTHDLPNNKRQKVRNEGKNKPGKYYAAWKIVKEVQSTVDKDDEPDTYQKLMKVLTYLSGRANKNRTATENHRITHLMRALLGSPLVGVESNNNNNTIENSQIDDSNNNNNVATNSTIPPPPSPPPLTSSSPLQSDNNHVQIISPTIVSTKKWTPTEDSIILNMKLAFINGNEEMHNLLRNCLCERTDEEIRIRLSELT